LSRALAQPTGQAAVLPADRLRLAESPRASAAAQAPPPQDQRDPPLPQRLSGLHPLPPIVPLAGHPPAVRAARPVRCPRHHRAPIPSPTDLLAHDPHLPQTERNPAMILAHPPSRSAVVCATSAERL